MLLWISSILAIILSITLFLQLRLLFSSGSSFAKTSYSLSTSSLLFDLPSLALDSQEEIIQILGTPEKIRRGSLASGKSYEEFVYPHNRIMITFIDDKASRFSILMDEHFSFPEDAEKALENLALNPTAPPSSQNNIVLKWENQIDKFPLVSIINKNGQIDYVNVVAE